MPLLFVYFSYFISYIHTFILFYYRKTYALICN